MSKQGLQRVVSHIEPGGILALSLQGIHSDYTKELTKDLIYSQAITKEDNGFLKHYEFRRNNKVVASQDYRYSTMTKVKTDALFDSLGCEPRGLDDARQFYVYRKR